LLVPCVGLYPVMCLRSAGGNFGFCAVDVLRLGVSYYFVNAWAYVYIESRSHEHKENMVLMLVE